MLLYALKKGGEFFDDVGYNTRRAATHIVGKGGIVGAKEGLMSPLLMGGVSHFGAALMVAAPLSAAFSSAIVQGDHIHRRDMLRDQYRKEISAWLGGTKRPEDITDKDLELAAYGDAKNGIRSNPSLKEALNSSRDERNMGIGVSAITSIATTAILTVAMHAPPLDGLAQSLGDGAIGNLAVMAVGGVLGLATYLPISTAMHWVAEKIYGEDKEPITSRIRELHRAHEQGKAVSQEKVLEVFLEARPELNDMIAAGFGKRYNKLDEAGKSKALQIIGEKIGLEQLTQDINLGKMRAEELAFAVHGQISGVVPGVSAENARNGKGLFGKALERCAAVFSRSKSGLETTAAAAIAEANAPASHAHVPVQETHEPERKTSFVQMVGARRGTHNSMSFVEQVEHSRSGGEVQIT